MMDDGSLAACTYILAAALLSAGALALFACERTRRTGRANKQVIEGLEGQIDRMRKETQDRKTQLDQALGTAREFERMYREVEERIADRDRELLQMQEEMRRNATNQDAAVRDVDCVDEKRKREIRQLGRVLEDSRKQMEDLNEQLEETRREARNSPLREEELKMRLKRIAEENQRLKLNLGELQDLKGQQTQELETFDRQVRMLESTINTLERRLTYLEEENARLDREARTQSTPVGPVRRPWGESVPETLRAAGSGFAVTPQTVLSGALSRTGGFSSVVRTPPRRPANYPITPDRQAHHGSAQRKLDF
jgi:hypothetical protein